MLAGMLEMEVPNNDIFDSSQYLANLFITPTVSVDPSQEIGRQGMSQVSKSALKIFERSSMSIFAQRVSAVH